MENVVILGAYFSKVQHPQFPEPHLKGVGDDARVLQNDINYFQGWYESVKRLDINAVVFYDNLTNEFVKKYQTDKIKFIYSECDTYVYNVGRFFCFRDFLRENKFDAVFTTDISDIIIVNNPIKLIESYPDVSFFVGKDSIKLHQFPYLKFHQLFKWENYFDFFIHQFEWDLINCGVIGGNYENMLSFLENFCQIQVDLETPKIISDMFITNYLIRKIFSNYKSLIGEPVTSNFKKYENNRKDVYFIHK